MIKVESEGLRVLESPPGQARVSRLLATIAAIGDQLYALRVIKHRSDGQSDLDARGQAALDVEKGLFDALDRLCDSIREEYELRTAPPGGPVQ